MSKSDMRRHSSIPSYIVSQENAVKIAETDLRWRRSSHAAITSLLPSYGAFHSDTGLSLNRAITEPQRRKSATNWRKSFAAIGELGNRGVESGLPERSFSVPTRKLMRSMSVIDTWKMRFEERQQTVESIKSMTATIAVKKKYRKVWSVFADCMWSLCRGGLKTDLLACKEAKCLHQYDV